MFTPQQDNIFPVKVYLSGATEYQKYYSKKVPQYVQIYLSRENMPNHNQELWSYSDRAIKEIEERLTKEILHKVLASSDVLVNIHCNFCEIKYHGPGIIGDILGNDVYLCLHQDH